MTVEHMGGGTLHGAAASFFPLSRDVPQSGFIPSCCKHLAIRPSLYRTNDEQNRRAVLPAVPLARLIGN